MKKNFFSEKTELKNGLYKETFFADKNSSKQKSLRKKIPPAD
jgi:hypothetical protein